jgi:hypothetical protein
LACCFVFVFFFDLFTSSISSSNINIESFHNIISKHVLLPEGTSNTTSNMWSWKHKQQIKIHWKLMVSETCKINDVFFTKIF